ncbi:TPM domain-containing protein [Thauera sinica]|uniref:TPM domain-containing protein n=1 Tax=Thauera sinica TaxID=2665146 RepID=A0ABW1AQ78_9RHOO|nr:TPM domain-containing protein [Thauera sp. K11]ATE59645.1 hypothetical protein CCZ27_06510 [Thauera sp. K11]
MGFLQLLRHLWLDDGDARRALGAGALERLTERVRDSERHHSGEICICVEASLPLRYLWRHLRHREATARLSRERALERFGEQRVWDTEYNNGVLIYVLLAEHRIEIVADRGIVPHTDSARWQDMLRDISACLGSGRLEDGLAHAIDAVDRVLRQCFPSDGGPSQADGRDGGGLPDRPVIL